VERTSEFIDVLLAKYYAGDYIEEDEMDRKCSTAELPNDSTIFTSEPKGRDHWVTMHRYNSGYGLLAGCCEHGNEPLGSMKAGPLSDCKLLKTH
jgi:hypothetical protein